MSPYNFILEPEDDKRFLNRSEEGLVMNVWLSHEDGRFINRVGNVMKAPLYNTTSAKKGDRVVVQHNTFRNWLGNSGKMMFGSLLDEGKFFCPPDHVFAYESEGEWYSTNEWIFLTPEVYTHDTTLIVGDALRPDRGTIALPIDPRFESEYKVGDEVILKFDKFIPVNIGNEAYYRVRPKDILLLNDRKRSQKAHHTSDV